MNDHPVRLLAPTLPQRLILRLLATYRRGDSWPRRKLIRNTLRALDMWNRWDYRARQLFDGSSSGAAR